MRRHRRRKKKPAGKGESKFIINVWVRLREAQNENNKWLNWTLTASKSFRVSFDKCKIFFTVPSARIWKPSSNRACSFHQDTRGGGIPPLDIHVILMCKPSPYGPIRLSIITAPSLSRMVNCVGGTAIGVEGKRKWYDGCKYKIHSQNKRKNNIELQRMINMYFVFCILYVTKPNQTSRRLWNISEWHVVYVNNIYEEWDGGEPERYDRQARYSANKWLLITIINWNRIAFYRLPPLDGLNEWFLAVAHWLVTGACVWGMDWDTRSGQI